ncbi:helix-turn-helix transcriptional regulator [Bradyrhizobium sp. CB1015]|uniref:helix-turn-helix transcriptional regulator n=1 Tax=Bradyrhizobium sp. CB1015 TaxID=2976822 RepID=UPI0021AA6958|nr:helix-turn-helix transcriptional regulator [Bradyrhizobium sp. CB1015]UWU89660.1 helix-turn-helix transcriptional regulator [Bradyrhizobium sp. CB1015]
MADLRRVEFGDFLRSRREKLSPKAVGLPMGRRRRTAGLRREEVAQLAGIGVDWYIRLEQGRTVSPSVTTVDALALALRLSKAEHAHLMALARERARSAFTREIVPPPIRRMIESLQQPAYVTGRRWDVLAWNDAAEEVFGFGRSPEQDRNTLLLMMTNKQTRKSYGAGWTGVAKAMVAMFRANHDVWAGDPAFTELLTRLREGSPEFVEWWDAHDVRSTISGRKTMNHPTKGVLHFEHTSFQANDDPALKLVIYTPVEGGD